MKTFKGSASLDFTIVVASQFIQDLREAAKAEDASEFLKITNARHPVNDDAFIGAVLSNGIRHGIKHDLGQRLSTSNGLGGRVSPASITLVEAIPDHDAPNPQPQVVEVARATDAVVDA